MKIQINVLSILLILLVGLKAAGLTEISWLWALSPMWIPCGLLAILLLFLGFWIAGTTVWKLIKERKSHE